MSREAEIFDYVDYRRLLSDRVNRLRSEPSFNVRSFAAQAGLRAPGYLKMVIDGKRNLTVDTVEKFCRALGIQGRERLFFEKLVLYNQATDPDLKRQYFDDLMTLKPRSRGNLSETKLDRYLSHPHYALIREMVALGDFREDAKWIARRLSLPLRPAEVREAIEALVALGLLKRGKNGKLEQAETMVKTEGRDTQAAEAYHFHESVLNLSRRALATLPQEERHFHAMTLPLPKKMFPEIINEFYQFRDRVLAKANNAGAAPDEVFQTSFQFFPLTKKGGVS